MKKFCHQRGISIVEVIIAAAIFVIFATPAVVVVLSGLNMNRLSVEQTIATQFASEGIEAVRSIKNQAYNNLLTPNPTPRGVVQSGGVWTFQGDNTTNTFTHNGSDNYVRSVKIENVSRDAAPPNGNIVSTGGTADANTKKVTSTVSWNFSAARPESVSLVSYLSDWRKALGGGLLVYGNGTTSFQYRAFDSTTGLMESAMSGPAVASGLNFSISTSPTKAEAIAAYTSSTGVMEVFCFDGVSWSNEWSVSVGGSGSTSRFDIAYEHSSGDALVVYSGNSSSNQIAYRTKSGSTGCGSANWSGQSTFSANTGGIVQWVQTAEDRRAGQNLIAVIWADTQGDLGSAIWDGTTLGNEPSSPLETTLEVVSGSQDIESFDVEYESLSGNVMVVWGSGGSATTNGAYYNRCTGGTAHCTWGASRTAMPSLANDATTVDISANPDTDEIVFASIGNAGGDLQVGYWSGSAWINTNDIDTSAQAPTAGTKKVSTGWLINGSKTRSIIVYADSTATATSISYYAGNGGSFSAQTDFAGSPVPGSHRYYDIQMDPLDKSKLLLVYSDVNSRLYAKQLSMSATPTFTWSNTEGGSALETTLGQAIRSPFGFSYWRNP